MTGKYLKEHQLEMSTSGHDFPYVVVGTSNEDFSVLMKVGALKKILAECDDLDMIRLTRVSEVKLDFSKAPYEKKRHSYNNWTVIPRRPSSTESTT